MFIHQHINSPTRHLIYASVNHILHTYVISFNLISFLKHDYIFSIARNQNLNVIRHFHDSEHNFVAVVLSVLPRFKVKLIQPSLRFSFSRREWKFITNCQLFDVAYIM